MNDISVEKFRCAKCNKTLMIGNLSGGVFTVKCKKCGAINLIKIHPVISIQEVPSGMMNINREVISVALPKIKPRMITIK